jgi:hypothetical protein
MRLTSLLWTREKQRCSKKNITGAPSASTGNAKEGVGEDGEARRRCWRGCRHGRGGVVPNKQRRRSSERESGDGRRE